MRRVLYAGLLLAITFCALFAEEKILNTIKGKVEVNRKERIAYFIVNWESKSRVTFTVIGNLTREVMRYDGRVIEVIGDIKPHGKWDGTINIIKIITPLEEAIPQPQPMVKVIYITNIVTLTNIYVHTNIAFYTNFVWITNTVTVEQPHRPKPQTEIIIITGNIDDFVPARVEVGDDGEVYLVFNPDSRSRASFKVVGRYKRNLFRKNGSWIKFKGKIERTSDWSGTVDVREVIDY